MNSFLTALSQSVPTAQILCNEPLSQHTSFRIGGPARAVICPESADDIPAILRCAAENGIQMTILGNGTNVLAPDEGLDAYVLKTAVPSAKAEVTGETLCADAGCTLAHAAVTAQKAGLAGMAFAHGIPGSVGGAVVMNAGAYGGEVGSILTSVDYCDLHGNRMVMPVTPADFGYRRSPFSSRSDLTVISAEMKLTPGDPEAIRAEMNDLMQRRTVSQPLNFPSAGSVFKRPTGYFAGKLIQDAGLKGYTIGGAQVSPKHSGFIVNIGGATCDDVKRLILHIQKTVLAQFGVELECEVRFLGGF